MLLYQIKKWFQIKGAKEPFVQKQFYSTPVAIRFTLISPFLRVLSSETPKIIFVFWSAIFLIKLAIKFTSNKATSLPLTANKIPFAFLGKKSSKGDRKARLAAERALPTPSAFPIPSKTFPEFFNISSRSAKSILIIPDKESKLKTPSKASTKILSTFKKASSTEVVLPEIFKTRSLGIVKKASTFFLRFSNPNLATLRLKSPSKEKGRVTTAKVKIPILLDISPKTETAGVPEPPPSPQVKKTISAPFKTS